MQSVKATRQAPSPSGDARSSAPEVSILTKIDKPTRFNRKNRCANLRGSDRPPHKTVKPEHPTRGVLNGYGVRHCHSLKARISCRLHGASARMPVERSDRSRLVLAVLRVTF